MSGRVYRTTSRFGALVAALALALSMTSGALADSVLDIYSGAGDSLKGRGSFEAELRYRVKDGQDFGKLFITITNTSSPANGGYLTGLVFNIDSADPNASASLRKNASHAFKDLAGAGLKAKPYGSAFDAGIAVGKKWSGGGAATKGIAAGDTGTFKLRIKASDFASLTAASFMNGPLAHNFAARFRAFAGGGNDKVVASVVTMPLPAPALLGAAGLLCVLGLRRRLAAIR